MEVTTTHLEKIITSLKKSCELVLKCDNTANLDEYLKMAAEVTKIDLENSQAKAAIDSAGEAETEEEFDRIFQELTVQGIDAETIKRNRIYKDFERYTHNLLNKRLLKSNGTVTQTTVSNEIEMTETSHSIDPITKGPLIRPVRNRHCNHIYGYQSVIDSLEINRRLRCPVAGCSNKQYVTQQDLIEM